MKIRSVNPFTEEVIDEFELMQQDAVDREVGKARYAFRSWSSMPVAARAACIRKMGEHLRAEKRTYAAIMTREMGKPLREAVAEVEKCAWVCDYYAEHGEALLKPEVIATDAKKSYVLFQPLGIVLGIMPWNFPFWQAFRFAIPALTAGNVILLKHASNVPLCALAIDEAFRTAGFPAHVFKTLLIDAQAAMDLIGEDKIDAVSLTGSNRAGEQVGALAGKRIKKLVLELGGSDPCIVLDDADPERAGRMAANARMINAGQSCIAAKRFIVMRKAAADFRKFFLSRLGELKVGDPMDEATEVGPLARRDILDALQDQLQDARDKGAEIVQAAHAFDRGLFFMPAAVFNPTREMKVLSEEVFGPIAPVLVVETEEEAIAAANDTKFGLGAAVWGRDLARAERVAAQIEAGCVTINDLVKSDPRLPFGGVKKSGVGRELSHYGLREFVNIKSVVVKE
jgi:succinate-semialdehyde dehydrogenase/glutarate-semialdehyde dehydrogenase